MKMKKRILSMLMAVCLIASMLPQTAFAAEGTTIGTSGQSETPTEHACTCDASEGEVHGEDCALYEASTETICTCETKCTEGTINDGCIVCSAEGADVENCDGKSTVDTAISDVQALIDALPDEVTAQNADAVAAQLTAIDEVKATLNDEQQTQLDFAKYVSVATALGSIYAVSPALDNEVRYSTDGGSTWAKDSLMNAISNSHGSPNVIIELLRDITLDSTWNAPQDLGYNGNTVVLDGKGFSITRNSDVGVFVVGDGSTVTLRNITIDGGAIWSGDDPATRTNSGVFSSILTYLIYVNGGATLTLDNGVILQNSDMGNSGIGGAAVVVGSSDAGNGKLIMNDGVIIRNNASGSGGAIFVSNDGDEFIMKGGTITGNYAYSAGGAVMVNGGSFIMSGGEISNNASGNNGGGVCVYSSFTLNGGKITGNKATVGGGGVSILAGTVELAGGSITGNTITGAFGGGLLVMGGSLAVSGSPVVSGNTDKNADSNIYLPSGTITVSGSLDHGALMGVTTQTAPTENTPVNITGTNSSDYSSNFISDAGYSVVNNNNVVQFAMLPCNVVFDANGGTGDMEPQSFISGVAQELSPNTFTFDKYDFDRWNTKADGSGVSYSDKESITISGDTTLYAQWKHAHNWTGAWGSNDTHHWKECENTGCPVTEDSDKGSYAEHSFILETVKDEALKSVANCTDPVTYYKSCECGEVSTSDADTFTSGSATGHSWATDWSKSETHHWHECENDNCPVTENSSKNGYAAHSFDNDTDTTCVCGYTRTIDSGGGNTGGGDSGNDDSGNDTPTVPDDGDDTPTEETPKSPDTGDNTPAYVTYTVQKGDTLWAISKKYGCTVAEIVAANSGLIKKPDLIYPGWQLKIPQAGATGADNTPDVILPEDKKTGVYIVVQGDTLWAISKKYGRTVAEIVALNGELITDPDLIFAGWELKIPQD